MVSNPNHGTLTLNEDGSFSYTPDENYYGTDSFTYKAYDGSAYSNVATVHITILPVNDPPVANDDYAITDEDTPVVIDVLANDSDAEDGFPELNDIISQPSHGIATINTNGTITYEPNENYYGSDSFVYEVIDSDGATNNATVHITILLVNHPPDKPSSPNPSNGATNVAITTTLTWQCSDIDNDEITYDVYFGTTSNPPKIASNITSNLYPATLQYSTTYYWKVVAWDEHGAKNESEIWHFTTEEYTPPNHPPTVAITYPSDRATVNGTITIKGMASDDKNVVKVEIRVDGKAWIQAKGTTSWSYSIDTTTLINGKHKIEAHSYDGSLYSNVASTSINVFNNHKPMVAITSPQDNEKMKGSIIIKGIAWDKDGNESIIKVEIRIDEKEWHAANGITSWSYEINTKELKNGEHSLGLFFFSLH